jgi:biopolymer transport protein TolR
MGMNLGQARSGRIAPPRMNVTPLVDVVLVLLIIFMVVTPLLTKKLWLHIPRSEEKNEPLADDDKPVIVVFSAGGGVRLNSQPVSPDELTEKLRRVMAARGDETIFFDADDGADYGAAVHIMDLMRGAGARVAVLTETALR